MKYRKGGYKYQLAEDFKISTKITPTEPIVTHFISLAMHGELFITADYAWDGASGPTWDTDNTMVPALVHDAFAQLMRSGLLSRDWLPYVNNFLDQMLKDRGMWWIRRRIWRRGLWLTGGSFAQPKNIKIIHEVN